MDEQDREYASRESQSDEQWPSTEATVQDSLTSGYAFDVDVREGFAYLRGTVQSIEDADHAVALLGTTPRVIDVVDETTLEPAARQ
jgi:BON domain